MVNIIPFGPHKGRSVEQVAIADANHIPPEYRDWREAEFDWGYLRQVARELAVPMPVRSRINAVLYRLENFKPVLTCYEPGCGNTAEFFTMYIPRDDSGVSVSSEYVFCGDHRDSRTEPPHREAYPLSFGQLPVLKWKTSNPRLSKGDVHMVRDLLLESAGFDLSQRKTAQRLEELVDSLEIKRPQPVQSRGGYIQPELF